MPRARSLPFACFLGYVCLLLAYSLVNSRERRVIMGKRGKEERLGSLEIGLLNNAGWVIPSMITYAYGYIRAEKKPSWLLLGIFLFSEIAIYWILKESLVAYIKDRKLFFSDSSLLPFNPSGHTMMFLNGVFLSLPVIHDAYSMVSAGPSPLSLVFLVLSGLVVYEYHRVMLITITSYHTFTDVLGGVVLFCLFRILVLPVRKAFSRGTLYEGEWGMRGYALVSLAGAAAIAKICVLWKCGGVLIRQANFCFS